MTFVTATVAIMATRRYTVSEVACTIFDEDFGLSDAETSEEETEEGLHAYLGDPVVESAAVDDISRSFEDTAPRDSDEECFAENSMSLSSTAANDENLNGESEYSGELGDESGRDSGNTSSSDDELFSTQEEDICSTSSGQWEGHRGRGSGGKVIGRGSMRRGRGSAG